jgi:PAS domain S-box-containing protein
MRTEFESVFQYAAIGMAIVAPDGRWLRVNKSLENMLGYSGLELLQTDFQSITHPRDLKTDLDLVDRLLRGEIPSYQMEKRYRHRDGRWIWALLSVSVIRNEEGSAQYFISQIQDISIQKTAILAKDEFLANMSHEIRTPLGAMLGFTELLENNKLSEDERSEYLKTIRRCGETLNYLINDILDLSKVEAGLLPLHPEVTRPVKIVEEVFEMLGGIALKNKVMLHLDSTLTSLDSFVTDANRLRQILVNVVGNAIKFTEVGSVSVDLIRDGNQILFTVSDTGIGMAPSQIPLIFEAFTQADSSVGRKFGGTGLGLTLSRKLARLLGGDVILLESNPGQGSRFQISVLNLPCSENKVEKRSGKRSRALRSLAGLKVLLVEDSPDNQELVQLLLSKREVEVDIADNGPEGLQKAMTGNYDLVLMDIQIPYMDGHKVMETLRRQHYDKPIIALTANVMKGEKARCLAGGFTDFISKPISFDLLYEKISKYGKADIPTSTFL